VTGVILDAPTNTNIDYSMLASFSSHRKAQQHSWWSSSLYTFAVLQPGAHLPDVLGKLNTIVEEAVGDDLSGDDRIEYGLLPLSSIHLDAPTMHTLVPQGNRNSLRILLAISLLVLIIACINYMNLTTARSVYRAREVGVRKVMGALKASIFQQFMSEAFVLTVFSMALAIGGMFLLYPQFEQLAGAQVAQPFTQDTSFWYYVLIIGAVVTFLAGSYPALVLANFKPLQVLRGSFKGSLSGQALRKGLVIVQFAISAVLIFGTITITRQLDYLKSTPLGYNQDQVISVPMPRAGRQDRMAMKEQLRSVPGVKAVGAATHSPHYILGGYSLWVEGMEQDRSMSVVAQAIDDDYLATTGIQLVTGRNFTMEEIVRSREENEEGQTPTPILVNQAAVKKLGETPESILGKQANMNGRVGPIVGVVKDFHFRSLHEEVEPLVMFSEEWQLHHIVIKLDGNDVSQTLTGLTEQWTQLSPERPFGYQFLDESYAAMYEKEERLGNIIGIFSSITIFIACLGLFGLASFTAVQRSKEVAVRRVLGASGSQVVVLLGRQFLVLMAIALLIALPLGYYFCQQWLASFAYRITPGVGIALLASAAVIGLGMFTVSFESIKAALANPIKNLKSE
ncbi:MAG TPA: hypothetical protein DCE41_36290, partial [Cytophagales bacterium]|nr:hypothetical protein [Cytophagales bacterium]